MELSLAGHCAYLQKYQRLSCILMEYSNSHLQILDFFRFASLNVSYIKENSKRNTTTKLTLLCKNNASPTSLCSYDTLNLPHKQHSG